MTTMSMMRMNDWRQCDVCARMTNRLHHGQAYGMDCSACDDCASYDWSAYDEDRALYQDEQPDPLEDAYNAREPHWRDDP